MMFDLFKHLTTLSTGSLLLVLAFVDKMFPNPEYKFLLIAVFVLFGICILGSLLAMFMLPMLVITGSKPEKEIERSILAGAIVCSIFTFFLGIVALMVFVGMNMA